MIGDPQKLKKSKNQISIKFFSDYDWVSDQSNISLIPSFKKSESVETWGFNTFTFNVRYKNNFWSYEKTTNIENFLQIINFSLVNILVNINFVD